MQRSSEERIKMLDIIEDGYFECDLRGLPAPLLFGGLNRTDTAVRVKLTHGVAVWGGCDITACCHSRQVIILWVGRLSH